MWHGQADIRDADQIEMAYKTCKWDLGVDSGGLKIFYLYTFMYVFVHICVCACVCMRACVCARAHVHVYAFFWRLEDNSRVILRNAVYLLLRQDLLLAQSLPIWPQGSSSLFPQGCDDKPVPPCPAFCKASPFPTESTPQSLISVGYCTRLTGARDCTQGFVHAGPAVS